MLYPVFSHDLHVQMWDWLAKNPDRYKNEWPGWHEHGLLVPLAHCFACSFAYHISSGHLPFPYRCAYCPLSWPGRICCLPDTAMPHCDSVPNEYLFSYWDSRNTTLEATAHIAAAIRDLPVRVFAQKPGMFPDLLSAMEALYRSSFASDNLYVLNTGNRTELPRSLPVIFKHVSSILTLFKLDYGDTMTDRYTYCITDDGIYRHATDSEVSHLILKRVE